MIFFSIKNHIVYISQTPFVSLYIYPHPTLKTDYVCAGNVKALRSTHNTHSTTHTLYFVKKITDCDIDLKNLLLLNINMKYINDIIKLFVMFGFTVIGLWDNFYERLQIFLHYFQYFSSFLGQQNFGCPKRCYMKIKFGYLFEQWICFQEFHLFL